MPANHWPDLAFEAHQAFRMLNTGKMHAEYLLFIHEPHFDNELALYLTWNDMECDWARLTWQKEQDAPKFSVINSLRYIGKALHPTLLRSSGSFSTEKIRSLLDRLYALTLPVHSREAGSIVLDGDRTTLCTGRAGTEAQLTWNSSSDTWEELNTIKDTLLKLYNELPESAG